ncbi:MAG: hypothetical protein AABZ50_03970 [Pseudomonadota bacterium]
MNTDKSDETFVARVRATLESRAPDELTRARLKAARLRALDHYRPGRGWRPLWAWSAGLSAAAMVMTGVVAGWLWFASPSAPQPHSIDDLELLAAQDNPEFYRELDFYQWLASRGETS